MERLRRESYRFEFFQAVRLLRLAATERTANDRSYRWQDVGMDSGPDPEIIKFRSLVSHSFPPNSISALSFPESDDAAASTQPPEMTVAFMGLTGPSGVLPQHYTQLVIDRVRRKDHAFRDFLDIFNHRLISLFYRAWEKYRVPVRYERAYFTGLNEEDLFLFCLHCLVGFGTGGLRGRLAVNDEVFLYYSGHFAHYPRNSISLERMLADYFGLGVQVQEFRGQWLYLPVRDQTKMQTPGEPDGRNTQLGVTALVGERVWGVENSFRLRLGPLNYKQFLRFTPEGDELPRICQVTRAYVGADFDFDVQPVLLAEETPWCQLTNDDDAARLGWNTWLRGEEMGRNPDDAVFQHSGNPGRI